MPVLASTARIPTSPRLPPCEPSSFGTRARAKSSAGCDKAEDAERWG
eukprot:CAMPEP_0198237426 /NCGR_PEP_ID=MMETSP1446-20131203/3288_1 /TAXON_ID=1461542 ORGANISM="Unidentified sp, Strain CCMP2111" /NCGR_SAMPLE_ID=MMETSP1446 /ASSEMBLY_ACC=CAM_ASM_001112 /LENGTH=46 /DNA_ID= /DNA_START= /DNA_END= /DNA_ORIENTATION=